MPLTVMPASEYSEICDSASYNTNVKAGDLNPFQQKSHIWTDPVVVVLMLS